MTTHTRNASKFQFLDWAEKWKLSQKTKKALGDNGLREPDTLMLLARDDIGALPITIAQQLRLRQALKTMGNPNFREEESTVPSTPVVHTPATTRTMARTAVSREASPLSRVSSPQTTQNQPPESAPAPLADAGRSLDALLQGLTTTEDRPVRNPPALAGEYDPRIHLTVRSTTKKALKIFNFLPEKVKERIQRSRRDRLFLSQAENGAISMHTHCPENYSITPAEWNSANVRLQAQLLASGDLLRDDYELYLAYTAQINDFAALYEWHSVLAFDTRYRELQAEHNLRWGDLRMAAHSTVLIPHRDRHLNLSGSQRSRTNANGSSQVGPKYTEDCKKWLASGGKACPFGSTCRYAHRTPDEFLRIFTLGRLRPQGYCRHRY